MNENDLNQMKHDIAQLKRDVLEMKNNPTGKIKRTIESPKILQALIEKYQIPANYADDIALMVENGELQTPKEIIDYIEQKLHLVKVVKENKNQGGESRNE